MSWDWNWGWHMMFMIVILMRKYGWPSIHGWMYLNASDISFLASLIWFRDVNLIKRVIESSNHNHSLCSQCCTSPDPINTIFILNHIYIMSFCECIVINYPRSFANLIWFGVALRLLMFHSSEKGSTSFTTCHMTVECQIHRGTCNMLVWKKHNCLF